MPPDVRHLEHRIGASRFALQPRRGFDEPGDRFVAPWKDVGLSRAVTFR
jgi:hypothetical protein